MELGTEGPTSRPPRAAHPILFVSHVARCGGAERTLLDLLECLDRSRYTPHVALPSEGELAERLTALGVTLHLCPPLRRLHRSGPLTGRIEELGSVARGGLRLRTLIRRLRPSIVHANSTQAACYVLCAVGCEATPLIWHVRDATAPGAVGRLLARRSARVVVPSRACAALLGGIVDRPRIAIIPSGVACDVPRRSAAGLRNELGPPGAVLAGLVAGLVPWKGHDLAIEAMRRVRDRLPQLHLLLVGDDRFGDGPIPLEVLRRRIAELGLGDRVRALGHREDVGAILDSLDFLVHPAYPEPFGRVVVEAMAAARPVIAFDGRHGPAEIVRDGRDGVLVSPRTPAALADAIVALASQPARARRMGANARLRALSLFDRTAMARKVEALYASLLADGPAHAAAWCAG